MDVREQKRQAREFVKRWENRGNERQDSQSFWIDLLQSVFGLEKPTDYIRFEDKVVLDHASFIDAYIDQTNVMIEQKGATKDLNKAIKQSDGTYLTPFQQAKRYSANLPYSQRPRWIITCNFKEFYIYDMEQPNAEAIVIKLADLEKEYYRLEFLVDKTNEHLEREMQISIQAGEIVGEIYTGLIKQYINPDSPETLHAINQLIVRLVFCLYAEDSGIFGHKLMFHDYLAQFTRKQFRRALLDLFAVLNTPIEDRDPYLDDDLAQFPYVNGGMFAEMDIEIPNFTDELRDLILTNASSGFDWSSISPTIFGAVFESTLNPDTRRSGGMHYTSIENIHKVIDPLFLDELKEELNTIRQFKQPLTVEQKAKQFQSKLATLTFFDPACGSGNFLTETYLSLRKLENEAIKLYMGDTVALDLGQDLVKVKLAQFYGIEINDFAVSVAKTALWIAESQMLEETKEIVFANIDFLPLKSYTNIVVGSALTTDWESVIKKNKLNYIIGNPPFVGSKYSSKTQKEEMDHVFKDYTKKYRKLDFVSSWYLLASLFIKNTDIKCAFVSTNSIMQGEQISILWPLVFENEVKIDFVYKSFIWNSDANQKAHVHCVIVGFSSKKLQTKKIIFDNGMESVVSKINAYQIEADNIFISSRKTPISKIKPMIAPNKPCDYNFLKIEPHDYSDFIKNEPSSKKWIKKMVGAQEFIQNKERYCLWLVGITPNELKSMPMVLERVKKCKEARLNANTTESLKLANTPTLFREQINPESYLIIPCVSSEKRKYIPIGFLDGDTIPVMGTVIVPNANLIDFGILTSNVHMAWMRTVAGRLEMRYRYSKDIVYNNFPWPKVSEEQENKIKFTAKKIIEARELYPESSLSDLYDELTMPSELRKAHQANDKAVMEAYGMTKLVNGKKTWLTESETVSRLFELYEKEVAKK